MDAFIEKAQKKHGDRYDYSNSKYINAHTKIKIVCRIHGEFEQMPYNHLYGYGCKKCGNIRKYTTDDLKKFITLSKKKHNDKYSYESSIFNGWTDKIEILCPRHGIFTQEARQHLISGCKKCSNISKKYDTVKWIEKANKVHGNKYDYSNVIYINCRTDVLIICKKHGEFYQNSRQHLRGSGCPKCSYESTITRNYVRCPTTNKESFVKESRTKHGNKYDYSKVEYTKCRDKVTIICPIHGEFAQVPTYHKIGAGCPKCSISRGEDIISKWLDKNNIPYRYNHKFDECRNINPLRFDFYIEQYNLCIEYDGIQHYKPVSWKRGASIQDAEEKFDYVKKTDNIKNSFCDKTNIKLIRIPYWEFDNIDVILLNLFCNDYKIEPKLLDIAHTIDYSYKDL